MRRATGALPLLLLLAGCSNPFASRPADYEPGIRTEQLRDIDPLPLAAPPPGTPEPDPLAAARARFEGLERVSLSLEECRAAVLANNLELRVALIEPTIANEALSEEEAAFEAAFSLRSNYQKTDTPTASTIDSAQQDSFFIEPGVTIPLRTGGSARISLPISRSETNNQFSTLNPAYSTDLQFSLSHELLRNAGRRAQTHGLRIATYGLGQAQARARLEAIRQLAAADRVYWRLFQAQRELEVRQRQFELAQALYERAQRLVEAGAVAEIEVVRSEAGIASALEAILIAQNVVLARQRELKELLHLPGLEVETRTAIDLGSLPDPVRYEIDPASLASHAVATRAEMMELELQLAIDASSIELAENQTLPLLTLDYTYRINGLGRSLGDSLEVLRDNDFEDWSLGLNASIPIGNEGARARLRRAILTRLQRLSTREARAQAIRREVLAVADDIETGWQRILAARQSVVLNARAYQAEENQFRAGLSTSTDVLDAATRLADAQSQEITAVTDYQISQVDLAFATGTVLGSARVRWDPVDPIVDRP